MNATITSLRAQLRQLQALHEGGALDAEALARARAPLEERLAALEASGAPVAARPGRGLVAAMVSVVLVLAVIGYAWTGSPRAAWLAATGGDAAQAAAGAASDAAPVTPEQMNALVEQLAQRMQERPDDPVGWAMLGRAYAALGRPADAVPAFRRSLDLAGDNPGVLADYADALATLAGGKLAGEPTRLVQRALALDPNHLKAQALAGSAAFDAQDYRSAARHWEGVARALPPDSPYLAQVRSSIAQARELAGMAPVDAVGGAAAAAPAGSAAASAASTSVAVTGRVSLAPALAARTAPTDTVFVVARAAEGPRMPLAVLRRQVSELPFDFRLDDSMAMTAEARLSGQPRVVVVARISRSGNALPQPGDLSGQSAPVAPGGAPVQVEIDSVLP